MYGNERRETETIKNNRQMLQGICVVCGTKKPKLMRVKKTTQFGLAS